MRYTITHRCGHKERLDMYGPKADREQAARDEAEDLFPACCERELRAKLGLPPLDEQRRKP